MANVCAYIGYLHAPSGSSDFSFRYSVSFTGSYTSGTAESINFLTATNPNGLELAGFIPSTTTATYVAEVSANLAGYTVNIGPLTNGTIALKFYASAGVELSTGAYPASITSGSVLFRIYQRG